MNFTEFIEATCRVADKLAIPSLYGDQDAAEGISSQELYDKYIQRPLHEKIEAYLLILAKNCLAKPYY